MPLSMDARGGNAACRPGRVRGAAGAVMGEGAEGAFVRARPFRLGAAGTTFAQVCEALP
jgi:hypothetical protein